jgi:hypothetical protein
MVVTQLYNGIYKVLANDQIILDYLGVGTGADDLTKAKHIQKRSQPQDVVNNLPLIAFYSPPGRREGRNMMVYVSPFVFDIYTYDDVSLAQDICERISDLFCGEISPFEGVESFQAELVTAHESSSDLSNTYCFTIVIAMSVSLDK